MLSAEERSELERIVRRGSVGQSNVQDRLRGLLDLPRSGAPRSISDERVAEVVRITLE